MTEQVKGLKSSEPNDRALANNLIRRWTRRADWQLLSPDLRHSMGNP